MSGSTLVSESKMMYYPTNRFETLRLLAILGRLDTSYSSKNELERITHLYRPTNPVCYDYLLKAGDIDSIKKHFTLNMGYQSDGIVVADLFCGKGEWLKTFKEFIPCNSGKVWLLGNEIETGRYKAAKKGLDYCYNMAFEDLQLPKEIVSLMLFNPPYGSGDGERNARRYLRMILDREYLVSQESSWSNAASTMVFVLTKKDMIDCLDLITQHFEIILHYKVNSDEYEKFKQVILIAKKRYEPFDLTSPYDASKHQEQFRRWKLSIENDREFSMDDYSVRAPYYHKVNLGDAIRDHKYVVDKSVYISNPSDRVWNWATKETRILDLGVEKLVVPKPPTVSEIANIIAAGYINHDAANEKIPHIAIGGIKEIVSTETVGEEGAEKTVTTKRSAPYLNILYATENGTVCIKELEG